MTVRYEHRSCLTNLHARSRLFTNTPRREGCRVKKIRTYSPLVSCRSTVSACPFQAMGRHRQAICDRKATPHMRHSSFFCQNRHVVQIFCLNLYSKGGSINYHRKVFLCQYFYVLSSCGLFLYKTGCASTIQTSLIVFGLLRFWFNLLVR